MPQDICSRIFLEHPSDSETLKTTLMSATGEGTDDLRAGVSFVDARRGYQGEHLQANDVFLKHIGWLACGSYFISVLEAWSTAVHGAANGRT